MQEHLITLLSTWISAQHTEAQMFYIQYYLYSSPIKITGNQTTDLKVHQTAQCLRYCNLWKDRFRCASSQQKAD